MYWKPILIRKAARARQQFNTACWGIILLALAIVYKVWQEGDWGPISPDGENGFLWLAGAAYGPLRYWSGKIVPCCKQNNPKNSFSANQIKTRPTQGAGFWVVSKILIYSCPAF